MRSLPPVAPCPVNLFDRCRDAVGGAVVRDRFSALRQRIVIDDAKTTRRDFWVQRGKRIHRRLVHIAIESQHRELLDRRVRQRVFEPALQKDDLFVEQSVIARYSSSGVALTITFSLPAKLVAQRFEISAPELAIRLHVISFGPFVP